MSGAARSSPLWDRRTIYDCILPDGVRRGKGNRRSCQAKQAGAGGNDAGTIHVSRSGVRTAVPSPCRYLHSAVSLISLVKDL
ncbi:MAG: hypothetical protein ACLS8R_06330 [Anaeromassilibacillus sp.]